MSIAGLKKQFNKANQYVSEKVGTAEATRLDEEFHEMERKVDAMDELVEELINKTREYLQPNPASRAKLSAVNTFSKVRGTNKNAPYPQPEGVLGETMTKYGKLLGSTSDFSKALLDAGETYTQCADVKYALEDIVRQNFLEPLAHLQNKDLKEVNFHRKKLHGRRLDYDCKKRKQAKDDELKMSEAKLEESKALAETAMYNLLDGEAEQISQLCSLVEAQIDFHRNTVGLLENLSGVLKNHLESSLNKNRGQHIPKPVLNMERSGSRSPVPNSHGADALGNHTAASESSPANHQQDPWANASTQGEKQQDPWAMEAPPAYASLNSQSSEKAQPSCKALFDFEALNEGELGFKEGQTLTLISQIDENWFEGSHPNGQSGYFPINYVQVVNPL